MQTQTANWQFQFEQFLQSDYRKISPKHHTPGALTVKTACQHVRVFAKWWEDKFSEIFSPEKITNYALRQFQRHSLDIDRVAPNTWNSRLWALGIFCQWIESTLGEAFSNLCDQLEQKKQGIRPAAYRSLSEKEIHDLMMQMERAIRGSITPFEIETNKRDSAIITLMLNTGLRVAEVSALDVTDITINERSGSVRVRKGKGDKERIVPLNKEVRDAIHYLADSASTALFCGKATERLSTRSIERIVASVCVSAGIPGVTPHWLRYTFAKRAERSDVPIETISEWLGHASIETTRIYLHSSMDEMQSLIETI